MKLSNFHILTTKVLGLRLLLFFAVLICFDWFFFACCVTISLLVVKILRQSFWHSALKISTNFYSSSEKCIILMEIKCDLVLVPGNWILI